MKGYERTSKHSLLRRTPVIIRVDGKAFHTFTRRINQTTDPSSLTGPSEKMHNVMNSVMGLMAADMQNVVFGYTQSDEISLLLRDWDKHETQQWFDANLQKLVSVSASIATAHFAAEWNCEFNEWPLAYFDSRAFNVPMEEVVNYFIWRQQDATRNSVQFIARRFFSHNQLANKNNSEIQEMLWREHGVNWDRYSTWKKRGSCIYRKDGLFYIDDEPPIFTQKREYIGRHLIVDE